MGPVDVRRLAAIDLNGGSGTRLRRSLIVTEFLLGAVVGTGIGVVAWGARGGLAWHLFAAWIATTCLNYVPLSLHALSLLRPGALEAELAGVDIGAELRRYTVAQAWIFVPLLFVVIAVPQARGRRPA